MIGAVVAAGVLRVADAADRRRLSGSASIARTRGASSAPPGVRRCSRSWSRPSRSTCPTASTSSAGRSCTATRRPAASRPALAADEGRQQRPAGDLARRAGHGGAAPVARHRRRAPTGSSGSASGPRRRPRRRRPLALLRGAGGARLGRAWRCSRSLSRSRSVVAIRRLGGPGATRYAAFVAAGIALLAARDGRLGLGDARGVRWFFGAAGRSSRRPRDARGAPRAARGSTRLIAGSRCLLVAVTPVTVALRRSRSRPRPTRCMRGDCAHGDRRGARQPRRCSCVRPSPSRCSASAMRARGQSALAVSAMRKAAARDPATGSTPTGSRSSQALAGQDPRRGGRAALAAQPARAAGARWATHSKPGAVAGRPQRPIPWVKREADQSPPLQCDVRR